MKKLLFIVLFISNYAVVYGYNWFNYGPVGIHANNILFHAGNHNYSIICTNSGICINNGPGFTWNTYNYGLPVSEAVAYDSNNVLLVMGNGSYSDGIYKFNLTTNTYNVVEWCYIPTFIRYCSTNNIYYVGTRFHGLLSSTDGVTWDTVPYFQGKGCTAMDFYGQHIVVTQENNIFATYYSDDGGLTWNQSSTNIPLHDIAFDHHGVLFGVFTGMSNSSGLYMSYDYGHTWKMEYFTDNMNTVGFDVMNNIFVGFHGSLAPDEGVVIYDTVMNNFTNITSGLPCKNIQKFKVNDILSSITMFVCTDTGVYYSNNYLSSIQNNYDKENNFGIYPNPARDQLTIVSLRCKTGFFATIYNAMGEIVEKRSLNTDRTIIDISKLLQGLYLYKITDSRGIILDTGKFIKE